MANKQDKKRWYNQAKGIKGKEGKAWAMSTPADRRIAAQNRTKQPVITLTELPEGSKLRNI